MILFRATTRAFFVHGFAKNERDNIDADALIALRKLADVMLEYDDAMLTRALHEITLMEVNCDEETLP